MSKSRLILTGLVLSSVIAVAMFWAMPAVRQSVETSVMTKILGGFSEENVQMRFMSFATTISPLKRLELAKLNQIEIFERKSERQLMWHQLKLPEVVIRATVPVEYRYHIALNNDWTVAFKDGVIRIRAPALTAGTPSSDVSQIRFEVRKGSVFRNEQRVARDLRAEITNLLQKRALESTPLVRETARQQIVALAQQWLRSEGQEAQVVVGFSDEAAHIP